MTDTGKRPDWLPDDWFVREAEMECCSFCKQFQRKLKCYMNRRLAQAYILCPNSPDCESAAREAIGGGK